MKNIIICEGGTDLTLLQYFMETTGSWKYEKVEKIEPFKLVKKFTKQEDSLFIAASGGSTKIINCLGKLLEFNRMAEQKQIFQRIIIVSDNDEIGTFDNFKDSCINKLTEMHFQTSTEMRNNKWAVCEGENLFSQLIKFEFLLLIIPFEETGAIETFLLNSIAGGNPYDKQIIEEGNQFVEQVDAENRYLSKRRYRTKAKFDVYFSVRTALEQFKERRNILRGVPWEQYVTIQDCFSKLKEL